MTAVRPRFYEQQYLGAADLEEVVGYGRRARARHDLGAHTWGIADGLALIARPTASGTQDVFVEPGTGWDGFGRPIVVLDPLPLPLAAFAHLRPDASRDGDQGRQVKVYLRHEEAPTGDTPLGFRVCEIEDQYSRVAEAVSVVVSDETTPSPAFLRAEVQVHGVSGDARDIAATLRGAAAPPLEDTSIAYQEFPDPWAQPHWLLPVGVVWYLPAPAGGTGSLHGVDAEAGEALRRYAGVVAGTVSAAGSHVRVRGRDESYDAPVWTDDLLWVQGAGRFEGDVRMLGHDVLFRSESNTGAPLDVGRLSDDELLLRIGDAEAGLRRLVVASVTDPAAPGGAPVVHEKLVVRDDGHTGLNGADPALPLTIKADSADETVLGLLDSAGALDWRLALTAGANAGLSLTTGAAALDQPALFVSPGGKVGVGTATPDRPLAVRGTGTGEELVSFEDAAGTTKWHLNQRLGGDKPGLNFVESGIADARLFLAAGGNVGIGTPQPEARLHVANGGVIWGNHSRLLTDQGGSIELGGDATHPGAGTPFIDFHFAGLAQDFNTRLINDADGRLTASADTLRATQDVDVEGEVWSNGGYTLGPTGVRIPVDVMSGRLFINQLANGSATRSFVLTTRLPAASTATFMIALSDIGNVNVAHDARWVVTPGPVTQLGTRTFEFEYSFVVGDSDGSLRWASYIVIFVPEEATVWILQDETLLEIPDDAPLPPGSTAVETPDGFVADPDAYIVTATGFERRPRDEYEALRRRDSADRLTPEDVAVLKELIKERAR